MKKIIQKRTGFIAGTLMLVFLIVGVLAFILTYNLSQCNKVVSYSIGSVDPKFKISEAEVLKITEDSADRWNTQTGKKLLKYDSKSKLKINLIYDYRQAEYDRISSLTSNLDNTKSTVDSSNQSFNSQFSQFEKDLAQYNSEVDYWNSRGGAPSYNYNELQSRKAALDKRHAELVKISEKLNIKIDQYNSSLIDYQKEVDSRKNTIITQGLYKPIDNRIDIFTFGNSNELRLVLMHELGHSLSLDHATDNQSIMHYLLADQSLENPTLADEDKIMISDRCDLKKPTFYQNIFKFNLKSIN